MFFICSLILCSPRHKGLRGPALIIEAPLSGCRAPHAVLEGNLGRHLPFPPCTEDPQRYCNIHRICRVPESEIGSRVTSTQNTQHSQPEAEGQHLLSPKAMSIQHRFSRRPNQASLGSGRGSQTLSVP